MMFPSQCVRLSNTRGHSLVKLRGVLRPRLPRHQSSALCRRIHSVIVVDVEAKGRPIQLRIVRDKLDPRQLYVVEREVRNRETVKVVRN